MKIETKKIIVLAEHRDYLPKLSLEELKNLETSIREHGIQTPLIVMKGTKFLLDGHNRLDIAKRLKIPFVPIEIQVTNNAEDWILRNQLSRRNLQELDRDKLIAALHKSIKAATGKDRKAVEEKVAALAKEAKVSASTLKRIVKQQEQIEELPEEVKAEVKAAGTRRAANEILQKVSPMSSTLKLKNEILNYKNLLTGVIDGAANLHEDGLKGINEKVSKVFKDKELLKLIEWLQGEADKLKESRKKELEDIKTK